MHDHQYDEIDDLLQPVIIDPDKAQADKIISVVVSGLQVDRATAKTMILETARYLTKD